MAHTHRKRNVNSLYSQRDAAIKHGRKTSFYKYAANFFILKNKMFFVFERVHLHYYAIILSYCNYIIS